LNIGEAISLAKQRTAGKTIPGPDSIFQFHLLGEGGGNMYVQIMGGQAIVAQGVAPKHDVSVSIDTDDIDGIMHGRLEATSLYFQGKVKVTGDLMLAMRAASLLS